MKYLICNFKNKLVLDDIFKYTMELKSIDTGKTKLVLCPSLPFISLFSRDGYEIGAQDITSFQDKTMTGEITGEQLKSIGCKYVIVGHSERRICRGEINIDFINKINNALNNRLKVIYCIGETEVEKENGNTYIVLEKQISEVLNNVSLNNIIIAYEPVWAIGTGKTPKKEDIADTISFIKNTIMEKYETKLNVLYGGSVNEENIKELVKLKDVDGFLVGGASLDPKKVKSMITEMN